MDKHWLFPALILGLVGCVTQPAEESHTHEVSDTVQVTLWNREIELFIEYPPVIAGEPVQLVTHVTHVAQWQPRTSGEIRLILSMAGEPTIEIKEDLPARDGIYLPHLTFPKAGTWQVEIQVPLADQVSSLMLADVEVFPSKHYVMHFPEEESEDTISFLKEQQWRMPFASESAGTAAFREAIRASATIAPRAGGEVVIHAPVNGRLLASNKAMPHIGQNVGQGDLLGSLVPRLDQADDLATLNLALEKAKLVHEFARKDFQRLENLFAKEAIPKNRLNQAELEVQKSAEEVKAARERLQQFSAVQRDTQSDEKGLVHIYSPLSGTIIQADGTAGALLKEGDRLFHIIDLSRVWLNIQIPESDIGKVTQANGAWFEVEGLDRVFEVDAEAGDRLVALGGKIDARRRTLPLIFELRNPDRLLKIGMFAQVAVLTGNEATGVAIPVAAMVEEAGQTVAYVQTGGESFERRTLRLGIRDGNRVHVLSGIEPGERVVTQGAYQVRLAGASTSVPDHGHTH